MAEAKPAISECWLSEGSDPTAMSEGKDLMSDAKAASWGETLREKTGAWASHSVRTCERNVRRTAAASCAGTSTPSAPSAVAAAAAGPPRPWEPPDPLATPKPRPSPLGAGVCPAAAATGPGCGEGSLRGRAAAAECGRGRACTDGPVPMRDRFRPADCGRAVSHCCSRPAAGGPDWAGGGPEPAAST